MQLQVFHKHERSSAIAVAPKLKKCFKPKTTQTCQTAISVSMVIQHSPAPSGELQICYTHTALSGMLLLRWSPVLGCQPLVNTEGYRKVDCSYPSDQVVNTLHTPFQLRRCHVIAFLKECLHLLATSSC